jgi:hypothetical protein
MSKTKKFALIGLSTFVFLFTEGLAGAGVIVVRAAATGNYPAIIQNLASKFGLKQEDVAQVFADTKKQQTSDRLDEAVQNKLITTDQKNLILSKQEEITAKINEIDAKQLTAAERQTQMQTLMSDVKAWATQNNIPLRFVEMGLGRGSGFGRGFGDKKGMMGPGRML